LTGDEVNAEGQAVFEACFIQCVQNS